MGLMIYMIKNYGFSQNIAVFSFIILSLGLLLFVGLQEAGDKQNASDCQSRVGFLKIEESYQYLELIRVTLCT